MFQNSLNTSRPWHPRDPLNALVLAARRLEQSEGEKRLAIHGQASQQCAGCADADEGSLPKTAALLVAAPQS